MKAQIDSLAASIVASNGEEESYAGLSLLERLVNNIIKDPAEQKFRSFKRTNAKIASTILSLQGGIEELIQAMGFTLSSDGEKYEFNGSDLRALKRGSHAIEEAIEPTKVKKMSKEERDKYMLLKQQKAEYMAMKAKQDAIKQEQQRLQKADRAEKATEEVKASKANELKFGADTHVFKPPVSR